ncbi:endolytic transglycosylase MltG [Necropsobacter massiliensis]|uniref:endolytic transglycosylase MltG n=1 Tax=Necropsobacter massiliensis TaxID=1400001 RepID=UPI00059621C5|nr:endolytic transglycosylase MltG [Necropsobacter massiliensis]
MKKCFSVLLILLMLASGSAWWGYRQLLGFAAQPVQVAHSDQLLTVERGVTGTKLAALLEQQGLLQDARLLPWLLKLQPQLNKVKAGTYSLNGVHTVADLLQVLNAGKEAQFSVQFIEGDTFKSWRKKLENAPHLAQTLQGKNEAEIYHLLALPQDFAAPAKIEGWLYPDTYHYTPGSSDLELLQRAAAQMKKRLAQAWAQRDNALPLENPYQMLILASIVEKETALTTERGKIAGVFVNRLNNNMKLQTDPTVIYGMGEHYTGNIRRKDLEQATPYNTYVIDGLPPTPIAMPSESALMAVAQPEKHDFLYFVADGSGGHKFSRTLTEHHRAVQEYLRWYRTQQGQK